MYLPKEKTEKTEEDTMETKITTAEKLAMELYGCMNSAVLDYGDYTVAVWLKHRMRQVLGDANAGFQGLEEKKDLRMPGMQWHGHSQM